MLRRLLHYARPYRRRYRFAGLFSVLNKLFDLAPPLLIGLAVDTVALRENSALARWGVAVDDSGARSTPPASGSATVSVTGAS